MDIVSSAVQLSSQHQLSQSASEKISIRVFMVNPPSPGGQNPQVPPVENSPSVLGGPDPSETDIPGDTQLYVLKLIIEKLTGKKIKLFSSKDLQPDPRTNVQINNSSVSPPPPSIGATVDIQQTQTESETSAFFAKGVVKTSDGKEINFSAQVDLTRSESTQQNFRLRYGAAQQQKDPLVINYGTSSAQVTNNRFLFDLNSDGNPVPIPVLGDGSGYLVLDKSGSGKIDNGTELFGPATGDGFAELQKLDANGNGWIDQQDPAYSQLRIWTKDSNGNDQLSTLKEKGIDAIYLGKVSTPFDLKTDSQSSNGQLEATGVFLNQDGQAGIVQQIDFRV